jgi:hypothetical protein
MRILACVFVAAAAVLLGQETIYDEAKVPPYTLPNVLALKNGEAVRDAKTWTSRRRPEILEMYRTEVYGRSPARPATLQYEVVSVERGALGGKAVRKLVTVYPLAKAQGRPMHVLLYLPADASKPVPVFLGLAFNGIHSVAMDPGVPLAEEWVKGVKRLAQEDSRGKQAQQWQAERILAHGYGLATVYYGDIEPDFNGGRQYGIRTLFPTPAADPQAWGAIGAWAWGLSRTLDYLEKDRDVDARRVAVFGHSRLGKTALWAGAQDTRFALVISNDSGEGGAAISRRDYGERTKDLNTHFPYWFCGNFKKYNDREDAMPFDSHMLLALVAPRPLYVASAVEDRWSDPRGEFLGAVNASPVWELFGKQGLGADKMPELHQPIMHTVAYHIRAGKHDVTEYDWEQYLKFADIEWGR